jgi:hypothetical protein
MSARAGITPTMLAGLRGVVANGPRKGTNLHSSTRGALLARGLVRYSAHWNSHAVLPTAAGVALARSERNAR